MSLWLSWRKLTVTHLKHTVSTLHRPLVSVVREKMVVYWVLGGRDIGNMLTVGAKYMFCDLYGQVVYIVTGEVQSTAWRWCVSEWRRSLAICDTHGAQGGAGSPLDRNGRWEWFSKHVAVPLGAYCKLTRPTGACCFISVGHFRYYVSRLEGGNFGCRRMPLRRVGAGVGVVGTGSGNRRNREARGTELSELSFII